MGLTIDHSNNKRIMNYEIFEILIVNIVPLLHVDIDDLMSRSESCLISITPLRKSAYTFLSSQH